MSKKLIAVGLFALLMGFVFCLAAARVLAAVQIRH